MEYLALIGWSFCVLLLIFFLHERTTSKRLRQELESQRLRALETANAPAVLAHEIRTPLALIRGAGELLSEGMAGELTDTQRQFLHTMMTNTQRVIALAESMLTDLKTAFIRPARHRARGYSRGRGLHRPGNAQDQRYPDSSGRPRRSPHRPRERANDPTAHLESAQQLPAPRLFRGGDRLSRTRRRRWRTHLH